MGDRTTETPVPTSDLVALSNTLVRVDQNVKSIKNDLLPPLAADTREARDKARAALGKIEEHKADTDAHGHPCTEGDRQERQDSAIADMRPKVAGLDKWRWWLMGLVVLGLSSAIGFSLATRGVTTENATTIGSHTRELDRHEREIDTLEKAQQADRETYLREVRNLPQKVSTQIKQDPVPPPEVVERAVEDLPLRPHERRQLEDLIERARKRGDNGGG